ncbi:MAG: uncharacterized protein PWP31_163 [Clostridia bacterium]|nr:uncharacterized protein [Clostridia bacterium]
MLPTFSIDEILETIRMVKVEHLDIRTVTLGISLQDCITTSMEKTCQRIYDKVTRSAKRLNAEVERVVANYGIPVANKRIAVTPIAQIGQSISDSNSFIPIAQILDRAAKEIGIDFIGGFSSLVHKGFTKGDRILFNSLPEALSTTERVCASINVASSKTGINIDAISDLSKLIKEIAYLTANQDGFGCTKLVTFCNAPEDNPFMAGAFHGVGEPEFVINVGISGPGAVLAVLRKNPHVDLRELTRLIKNTAFKITRIGELVGKEVANRLNIPFGIVDLSLAPTNAQGDSVAEILEAIGLERCGCPGTTAALALLNDAVKKGGAMAASYVGGLSGAFIPVSEDNGMIRAVQDGSMTIEKLEALTAVCSVGLDMFAIPGDTPAETIAGIIADEAAIGVINNKTTAVRVIPVPNKKPGDMVEFGGLLGRAPIMSINRFSPKDMFKRGGHIPSPLQALGN